MLSETEGFPPQADQCSGVSIQPSRRQKNGRSNRKRNFL